MRLRFGSDARAEVVLVISGVFLLTVFAPVPLISAVFPDLAGYSRWAATSAFEVTICLAATMLLLRSGVLRALRELGLLGSVAQGFGVAFVATLPMLTFFGATSPLPPAIDALELLFFAGISPFSEELVFRGFAFWLLYKHARLGFWPAVFLPTLLFAGAHIPQGDGAAEIASILGLTAIASIWFSWLLLRWENLWVPVGMHVLMNGWWVVFAVDDTALGGWMPTAVRVLAILLSVFLTVNRHHLWKRADPGRPATAS